MTRKELNLFAKALAPVIRRHVDKVIEPLVERLVELESRPMPAGIAKGLIDRNGCLVFTLSDGETLELGTVVGRDGRDGIDGTVGINGIDGLDGKDGQHGKDGKEGKEGPQGPQGDQGDQGPQGDQGDPGEPGPQGEPGEPGIKGLDGKDGAHGRDGRDGAPGGPPGPQGPRGEPGSSIEYLGIYEAGKIYQHGNAVTFGGSLWIANIETDEKPGPAGGDWRLAVKKGRDARRTNFALEGKP